MGLHNSGAVSHEDFKSNSQHLLLAERRVTNIMSQLSSACYFIFISSFGGVNFTYEYDGRWCTIWLSQYSFNATRCTNNYYGRDPMEFISILVLQYAKLMAFPMK